MIARRNQDWGEIGALAAGSDICATDAELAAWYGAQPDGELPLVGLVGGDLYRTLGGRGDSQRPFSAHATRVAIDVLEVRLDSAPEPRHCVAHLVARRSWLFGPLTVVMNADFRGSWNVAPRAHPGDGRLDVLEVSMGLSDRLKAWRRLPSGTHVPHPEIRQKRSTATEFDFDRPRNIWLDGHRVATASRIAVSVVPAAVTVVL